MLLMMILILLDLRFHRLHLYLANVWRQNISRV